MTSVLTDEEIDAVAEAHPYNISLYTRAIEAAVIRKLAAGVSVEPVGVVIGFEDDTGHAIVEHACEGPYGPLDDYEGIYNLDQLTTAIAAARVQENERIVELCKKRWKGGYPQEVIDDLVIAIRALLGKEAQS